MLAKPEPHRTNLSLTEPRSELSSLLETHRLRHIAQLSDGAGLGVTTSLCQRDGTLMILKSCGSAAQGSFALDALQGELRTLSASLAHVPRLIESLYRPDGTLTGILRSYHEGNSIVDEVRRGTLPRAHFLEVLKGFLQTWDRSDFTLVDTDATNFIICPGSGAKTSESLSRSIMLIDPESLSQRSHCLQLQYPEDSAPSSHLDRILRDVDQSLTHRIRKAA